MKYWFEVKTNNHTCLEFCWSRSVQTNMGKKKASSVYVHAHTHNPSARESDDRRAAKLAAMEVTRLERALERQQATMRNYLPESEVAKKKLKIGICPRWHNLYDLNLSSFVLCDSQILPMI